MLCGDWNVVLQPEGKIHDGNSSNVKTERGENVLDNNSGALSGFLLMICIDLIRRNPDV